MLATIGGVEGLDSGTYPFSCRIHPFMHGTLIVR
jgi:plastocyanin